MDSKKGTAKPSSVWPKIVVVGASVVLAVILLAAFFDWRSGIAEKKRQQRDYQRIDAMIDSILP